MSAGGPTSLLDRIRSAGCEDRFLIGLHANERLRERSIRAWQIVAGLENAKLLRERPEARPNPVVEVEQLLPDGTPVKAVWAWLPAAGVAKLVTVHFFDR